jgi:hypothetical protein
VHNQSRRGKKTPRHQKPPRKKAAPATPPAEEDPFPDLREIQFTEEQYARIDHLTTLWLEVRTLGDIACRTQEWTESAELRENLALRLTRALEEVRREYPGLQGTPLSRRSFIKLYRQLEHAKQMIQSAALRRQADRSVAQAAVRIAESVQRVHSLIHEMACLLAGLRKNRDPIHLMAMYQADCAFKESTSARAEARTEQQAPASP